MPIKDMRVQVVTVGKDRHTYRGSATDRGYGKEWQKLRKLKLQMEPLCRICLANGRAEPATEVDHIIPKPQTENAAMYTLEELQSLCKSCHSSKSARENPYAYTKRCESIFLEDIHKHKQERMRRWQELRDKKKSSDRQTG